MRHLQVNDENKLKVKENKLTIKLLRTKTGGYNVRFEKKNFNIFSWYMDHKYQFRTKESFVKKIKSWLIGKENEEEVNY